MEITLVSRGSSDNLAMPIYGADKLFTLYASQSCSAVSTLIRQRRRPSRASSATHSYPHPLTRLLRPACFQSD